MTATNRDIREAVKSGDFRDDLFYRLSVIEIRIPPLRERSADILPLALRFLHRFAAENNRPLEGFTPGAERHLESYEWPGNVRELRNAVERAVILCAGREIGPELLPGMVSSGDPLPPEKQDGRLLALEDLEKAHIERVLVSTESIQEAASILGISTATLWRRRKKHGL